jgi:hypothetical protein
LGEFRERREELEIAGVGRRKNTTDGRWSASAGGFVDGRERRTAGSRISADQRLENTRINLRGTTPKLPL